MKAILWDMDGTLVDSEPLWGIATYNMSEKMGKRITEEVRALTVGGTTANTVRVCAEYAGLDLSDEDHQQWVQWMYRQMATLLAEELEFRPHIPQLLEQAQQENIPMALVTNTARFLTDKALQTIGEHNFTYTVCADEVGQGKPAPDLYLQAAHTLGVDPHDCLAVEDSTTGMMSAHSAGCRVLGVPTEDNVAIPEGVSTLRGLTSEHNPPRSDLTGLSLADLRALFTRISGKAGG